MRPLLEELRAVLEALLPPDMASDWLLAIELYLTTHPLMRERLHVIARCGPATSARDQRMDQLHFGLWVAMTVLMDFLTSEERAALVDALGMTASDYSSASARHREELQANPDSSKNATFQAARLEALAGGREQAIEQFNRFLDGLHTGPKISAANNSSDPTSIC